MIRSPLLAAAQSISVRGDVDANLEHHARLVRTAAQEGVSVLVFPELSLTGYEPQLAGELAFSEDDPRLDALRELAEARRMALVVGAPVRLAARLHIGAFLLGPEGTLDLYTKRHLGAGEESAFHPGDRDPWLSVGDCRAAVAVCADANHASHPARAAQRGAALYLLSSLIEPERLGATSRRLQEYARRHALTVVFANHGGPAGALDSGGGSAIWSAEGELLARLAGPGPGLVLAQRRSTGWRASAMRLG